MTETEEQRLDRLSGRDQAAIAAGEAPRYGKGWWSSPIRLPPALLAARAAEQDKYYAQFTFQPATNSSAGGSQHARGPRSRTAAERSRNEEGARARMRAAALAEAEFRAQHPFKPQLVTASTTATAAAEAGGGAFRLAPASDPERLAQRMREHQREKEARREAARRLIE